MPGRCTRLRVDGTPCRKPALIWQGRTSLAVPALPDPVSCIIHLDPVERMAFDAVQTQAEDFARWADSLREPACWSWPLPAGLADLGSVDGLSGADLERYEDRAEGVLRDWQGGRCAVCGRPAQQTDHDHITGLVRGLLCQSCNGMEGKGYGEVFAKYRRRNPAAMLGIRIRYYNPWTGYAQPVHRDPEADFARLVDLSNILAAYFADNGQGA